MPFFKKPVIADVGARFGLHPSLAPYQAFSEYHLFEPDPEEAKRLKSSFVNNLSDITVHPVALSNHSGEMHLKLKRHKALSTFYDFNPDVFKNEYYLNSELEEIGSIEVPVGTLDEYFKNKSVDFLKVDTEGADYDVLLGAHAQLKKNILAVRSEVTFANILAGRPHFGDIHNLLADSGFQLLNMDYSGSGVAASDFTLPGKYGQLLSTDATWIKAPEKLEELPEYEYGRSLILLANFMFNNSATDVAMWLLIKSYREHKTIFSPFLETSVMESLRLLVAKLIKDLSYVPGGKHEELAKWYERIFCKEFPPNFEYYYHFK